ncbi:MAG: hypothetical protein ABIT04_02170 [Novosphingobium sp.]
MVDRGDGSGVAAADIMVREFRQMLIWPIELLPSCDGSGVDHCQRLLADGHWREVSAAQAMRHGPTRQRIYTEFSAFMPDAQRFLYGEGDNRLGGGLQPSPLRIFRRDDVAAARIQNDAQAPVLPFDVSHVGLFFFYDIDLAILVVEVAGRDITLHQAQDMLFRFGRAYPTGWDSRGGGAHCCERVELLDSGGALLAASDYDDKDRYLDFFRDHRAPCIASHWAFLLQPLALSRGSREEVAPYRLLEHQRIPLLAWLAVDDPHAIGREDWMRLGHAAPPGPPGIPPFARGFLDNFESQLCYDRYWDPEGGHDQTATRILCSGEVFIMVGEAGDPHFTDGEAGVLALFRHQYMLLGLIAHFHRSALLIFRDRLFSAISDLRDYSGETVRLFKRSIRLTHENFLRFTHRYWFQEVSSRAPSRDLFAMWVGHLGTDRLFAEVREEVQDMIAYLDSDGLRRQANTVVRLTIVTFFGLIGTTATGVLGMNIFDWTHLTPLMKLLAFTAVLLPISVLTFYTAAKSQRLAALMDAVSDERQTTRHKVQAFTRVWMRQR